MPILHVLVRFDEATSVMMQAVIILGHQFKIPKGSFLSQSLNSFFLNPHNLESTQLHGLQNVVPIYQPVFFVTLSADDALSTCDDGNA